MAELDALGRLAALGLRDKEARVYLALVRAGETTAGALAKDTGIHPRSVYDALESLVSKGLVTFVERDFKRYFSALGIDAIMGWIDERKAVAEELAPILEEQRKGNESPAVRVFRGKAGIRSIMEDQLKEKNPIYYYGGSGQLWKYLYAYTKKWNKRRKKLGIAVKILFLDKPEVRRLLAESGWQMRPMAEKFATPFWLYGNKMGIILWQHGEPLTIMVESPLVARTYMHFFNTAWRAAKKQ